ncbi:LPP20 family lipoprotein [Sulfurospirillum sp. 1612]|uniref:LPP20 family lipoprotein n=1 Tax=Sulfurospirillum sp. 1612 TaxID=3094835 RepID=UPI002F930CE4
MNKFVFLISCSLGALIFFSGCNGIGMQPEAKKPEVVQKVIVQKASKKDIEKIIKDEKLAFYNNIPDKEFSVYGEGIAPMNTVSPAQAVALAKRAAVADAYRQLGEKLYGVQVNSKETIKDASLRDSRIETRVNGLIKNATITETSYKDGLYTVRMVLKMSGKRWKEIFSY